MKGSKMSLLTLVLNLLSIYDEDSASANHTILQGPFIDSNG